MINLVGILYETDTLNELMTTPNYIPPNSKPYYFCKENNIVYERSFSGQFVPTNDFDSIVKNHRLYIENIKKENESNTKQEIIEDDEKEETSISENNNSKIDIENHIKNIHFQINSLKKFFNSQLLPEDFDTKFIKDDINQTGDEKNV